MQDVIIIGAGIVGTAVARELSKYELKVMVLEKTYDIANGATKANSGIVHAGYDAAEGSLKAKLNLLGNEMYDSLCRELDVEFVRNGSLVIAFNEEEVQGLKVLYNRGLKNGVKELELISRDEALKLEPNIGRDVVAALYAKTAGIVSPYELAIALGESASQNGVEFKFNTAVLDIKRMEDRFIIVTNKGSFEARHIVNAAGLFADDINRMLGGEDFNIIPRRGEYCLLDKSQGRHVTRTIFQVPTDRGKGILVTPTIHGNLMLGPNSIVMEDKEDFSTSSEGLEEVIRGAQRSTPNINLRDIITSFTGVRATPSTGDFIINSPVKGAVNAAGIESPGLTAAPAIAFMVVELLNNQGLDLEKKQSFIAKRPSAIRLMDMSDKEKKETLKQNKVYGRIICRCEQVTEGDIVNAIKRPLGATTLDGIKKRMRTGGGRCQGGFCMPRILEILARELGVEPEEVLKAGEGSNIIAFKTR